MRPRVLMLPVSAIIILGLVVYKMTRTDQAPARPRRMPARMSAPAFQELDEKNRPVRLNTFKGRHEILVVFFDAELGADQDPQLTRIRKVHSKLAAKSIKVLAISKALPQENRKAIERDKPFPFPLLSDVDNDAHLAWGRFDRTTGQSLPGVFRIDRSGNVSASDGVPRPVDDLEELLAELTRDQ